MTQRIWVLLVAALLLTPAFGQQGPDDRADTFLDVMQAPVVLRTQADTGELIELEIGNTGFLELQIGDEIELPTGSEAQLRLGNSAVGVSGSAGGTLVRVVKATRERQTVTLNGVKLSFRDETQLDLSVTADGTAWAAVEYGSLNIYGPEVGAEGGTIRLLAGDLPKKFDATLAKGETLNLRVVDGIGSFTALAGKLTVKDGDGQLIILEEGQSAPADGQVPGLVTTLTVQEVAGEPITVQRSGEGGKIEQITEATDGGKPVTVDLKPNDLVTMGEGAKAEVKVGGSFVKLAEFTTFAVNEVDPELASINVLGVDLELDTVTIIEVAYGSLYVNVVSGTITAVADSGAAIQNFFVTLPNGDSVEIEVAAGGAFEIALAADGSLEFTNTGDTAVVIGGVTVQPTPEGEADAPIDTSGVVTVAGAALDSVGLVTTDRSGGTVVTEGTGWNAENVGEPIPGTDLETDPIPGGGVPIPGTNPISPGVP